MALVAMIEHRQKKKPARVRSCSDATAPSHLGPSTSGTARSATSARPQNTGASTAEPSRRRRGRKACGSRASPTVRDMAVNM